MLKKIVLSVLIFNFLMPAILWSQIKVHPTNPHFFIYKGQPVSLFGTYTHIMFGEGIWSYGQWTYDQWKNYIDTCYSKKLNVARMWINWKGECYERTGPGTANDGGLKYDVTKIDAAYLSRLNDWVSYAASKDIIIQLILFDAATITWGTDVDYSNTNAFASGNNINGLAIPRLEYFTLNNSAYTQAQALYITKVIDTLNSYDNWYFEIKNEGENISGTWISHVANFVKTYESANKTKQHMVAHDSLSSSYDPFAHSEIDVNVRVTQGTLTDYPAVHAGLLTAYNNPQRSMPCFYDSDGNSDSAMSRQDALRKNVWAAFTAGGHTNLIYDTLTNPPHDVPQLRDYINYFSNFKEKVNWIEMSPNNGLVNNGYCFVKNGEEYVIYLPAGGTVKLNMSATSGNFNVYRYNPRTGAETQLSDVTGGPGNKSWTMPNSNDWALRLCAARAGTLQFSNATYGVNENGTSAVITATRTGGSVGSVGVSYATSNGTAASGSDYASSSGTLSWANGDSVNKTFNVSITNDPLVEGNETVNLALTSPTGGAALGAQNTATLTIVDDEQVDTIPTVSINQPINGAKVSGNVTITATANDDKGINRVLFYIDNVARSTDMTVPYAWVWDTLVETNGTHKIKVVAYDTINQTGEQEITVAVSNKRPRSSVSSNYFNPNTGGKWKISYLLNESGHVSIRIYTASRELVKVLEDSYKDTTNYNPYVEWDGTNENGEKVANGIYIIKINLPRETIVKKLAIIK